MCLVGCLSVPAAKVGIISYNALWISSRKNGVIIFVPKPAGFGTKTINGCVDTMSYLHKVTITYDIILEMEIQLSVIQNHIFLKDFFSSLSSSLNSSIHFSRFCFFESKIDSFSFANSLNDFSLFL